MTKPIDAVEQTATDFEQAEAALLPGALSALTDSVFTKLTPSAVNAAIPVSGDVIAITGTDGNDLLLGTNGDDTISGLGGDDTIFGINGNDQISGGQGADFIDGGAGDDTIFGDEGNDRLIGGDGFDNIVGGAGDDFIEGDAGDDRLTGGDGNDTLNGGDGNDLFFNNTSGFDIMLGGAGDDTFDMAFGQPGDAIGGDGFDTVTYRGNTAEGAFVVINLLDELQNAGSAAGSGSEASRISSSRPAAIRLLATTPRTSWRPATVTTASLAVAAMINSSVIHPAGVGLTDLALATTFSTAAMQRFAGRRRRQRYPHRRERR